MPQGTAGFELVRSLAVWGDKIIDNVFIRPAHFLGPNATHMPDAVLKLLRAKPKHSPSHAIAVRNPTTPGSRTRLVEGKLCCGKYATSVPASLLACTDASQTEPIANGTTC